MSDLNSVHQKVIEGDEWRGTINVNISGDEHELTVRQLRDGEFKEVMSKIDREELQELQSQLPAEEMEEYQDLQQQEDLSEEESERLAELQSELEENDVNVFDVLSTETFEGIQQTAKYAVEPDEEDIRQAFTERAPEIESEYGIKVSTPEDVETALQDDIEEMIDRATNMASFTIGIRALVETVGEDEGN